MCCWSEVVTQSIGTPGRIVALPVALGHETVAGEAEETGELYCGDAADVSSGLYARYVVV